MTEPVIGIDISKTQLDVHALPEGRAVQFANTVPGRRRFLRWLRERGPSLIVFEPTGPYHRDLERDLHEAGLPLTRVNPQYARRFAEAVGVLSKTDRVDAAVLARMGLALGLKPQPQRPANLELLTELVAARRVLMRDRTANLNRQKTLRHPLLRRQCAARLRQIERQVQALEREMLDAVECDEALRGRLDILVSIPGVSTVTAIALMVELPELGTLSPAQAASLAGVAPMHKRSGSWSGRSRIRGGRALLRRTLYMPALVAARFHPDLRVVYDCLVAAGKPPKVAITALMRKLVILANALVAEGRRWQPSPPRRAEAASP